MESSSAASLAGTTAESPSTLDARIMIVDDEPVNVDLLKVYLQDAGYHRFISTFDSTEVFKLMVSQKPDVLLLDLMMPETSGLDILRWRMENPQVRTIPVIVLTASSEPNAKLKALEHGATDFLSKPVDPGELLLRLRNTLTTKAYQDQLAQYSVKLEAQVRRRTRELEASRQEAILCLARAAEYRDDDTGKHVLRVGKYAGILARQLGISDRVSQLLEQAAQLHDVGKIGIPDAILLKPGRLDPHEFELMKKHCPIGRKIIQPLSDREWQKLRQHTNVGAKILGVPSSPIMKMAAVIAQTHHEKWDGSGYPLGLRGEEIPLEGRIVAVADVYDALSSPRPYKEAFSQAKCFEILRDGRGKHFDPRVLDAFFHTIDEIQQVQCEFADAERHLEQIERAMSASPSPQLGEFI